MIWMIMIKNIYLKKIDDDDDDDDDNNDAVNDNSNYNKFS